MDQGTGSRTKGPPDGWAETDSQSHLGTPDEILVYTLLKQTTFNSNAQEELDADFHPTLNEH